MQLLDKCLKGNKIAPLRTCVKGVQLYCPSCTYPAIPYCTIFLILEHSAVLLHTRVKLKSVIVVVGKLTLLSENSILLSNFSVSFCSVASSCYTKITLKQKSILNLIFLILLRKLVFSFENCECDLKITRAKQKP